MDCEQYQQSATQSESSGIASSPALHLVEGSLLRPQVTAVLQVKRASKGTPGPSSQTPLGRPQALIPLGMLRWLWTNSDSTPREPFPNLVVGLQSATNLMHRIGLMLLMDLLAQICRIATGIRLNRTSAAARRRTVSVAPPCRSIRLGEGTGPLGAMLAALGKHVL